MSLSGSRPYDRISRNRFVTRYSYHHGFYDGVEREFRGFGRVDQLDTEEFAALVGERQLPARRQYRRRLERAAGADSDLVPHRRVSRGWPHLRGTWRTNTIGGAAHCGEPGCSHEQICALLLDDTLLPERLTPEEAREACRSLKG